MTRLPGKFVWFEHVSPDVAKARSFYESLFRWHVETVPMGGESYPMILNANAGIGGLRRTAPGAAAQWVSYLSVDDVDAAHAAALAHGGKSQIAPTELGDVGRAAAIVDSTGALLCVWKGRGDDAADVESTPIGGWFWNELTTPDAPRALNFYERVFGYTHDTMPMPNGNYYVLKSADGKSRAGLMQGATPQMPSMWLPYVHVADCDASVAEAQRLGAPTVCVPPTDIPQVGRFAVLIDPCGATFAVIRGAAGR